jgi:hypothetical protein
MPGVKGKGGIKGRSGRKSKAEEMGLASLLEKCWTLEDRQACIIGLANRAAAGDIESIKLLMAYTYGKPTEKHELSGKDGGPISTTFVIQKGNLLDADD